MNLQLNQEERYFNRELSWLEFNQRVLDQALDSGTPLLERLKFLAITGSNLDEFFMVRVGGMQIQAKESPDSTDIVGWSPTEQLMRIRERVQQMVADQYACLDALLPALAEKGICRLTPDQLSKKQKDHLARTFDEELSAVVSPIAVDDIYNFPAMIGASVGIFIRLRGTVLGPDQETEQEVRQRYAVLPVRRGLDRFWPVPSEQGTHFVLLEDLLILFAGRYFPNQEILEAVPFRTMRNADVAVDEDAADLLAGMKSMLKQRRTADCVRLEVVASASQHACEFLKDCLEVADSQIYRIPGAIDLSAFMKLGSVPGYAELKYASWPPQASPEFPADADIFEVIAEKDRVLFHPYESYQPVVDFVVAAASDPQVIAIKQTLYRTTRDSEMINALRKAAEGGKHVTVIVELRARFDEQRNIEWARKLEEAGVDVVFGVRGLKTHAKICLVVRKEPGGVKRYIHFGTGNYNESTARLYSDVSLFTCNEELGFDSTNLFNAVTGLSIPQPMKQLIAAPIELRRKISEMIDVEIANASQGRPALIRAKFNSLVDQKIIDRLYQASQAGVSVELNVRGICCLRPGVAGLSENIRVVSIVDRLLEHGRLFQFMRGSDSRYFLASADWMGRNLDRRIELMVPVLDPECAARIDQSLNSYFDDNVNSYELKPDGEYERLKPMPGEMMHRSQQEHYEKAMARSEEQNASASVPFRPHRAANESA